MALSPISFTNLLVNRRTHHKLIGHCNKHATWEQGPVQKSLIIDQDFFFLWIPPRELCAGISVSVGHKAFQVTPVPEGLQSMSALLVCAVMAHLEYNRHSCLDKARLVCLCALVHYFLFFFTPSFFCPLPCVKISPPPSFLYLSVVCPIDLFASAPLMVPSFGSFVNTLDIIAILCETKKRWN